MVTEIVYISPLCYHGSKGVLVVERRVMTLRVSPELHEWLREEAFKRGVSMNEVAVEILWAQAIRAPKTLMEVFDEAER